MLPYRYQIRLHAARDDAARDRAVEITSRAPCQPSNTPRPLSRVTEILLHIHAVLSKILSVDGSLVRTDKTAIAAPADHTGTVALRRCMSRHHKYLSLVSRYSITDFITVFTTV
ncbi:hypothetical protein DMN91_011153 [Ooceraea biroi]|uniref:Uncharacterized protein n=1 Tax=Ooceraea biroi TaxID=2015173 RepID=A0A3L8D9R4_OOCBI|nr:hypothetical protein DMN91_011153 [Ooceraea biroi]